MLDSAINNPTMTAKPPKAVATIPRGTFGVPSQNPFVMTMYFSPNPLTTKSIEQKTKRNEE